MTKTVSAREAALGSLLRCESQKRYSNLELDSAIKKYGFTGAEKNLYTRLVYGVIERKISLDHAISVYSDIPLERLDADTAMILRVALYQYYFLDRIPESALVNEAVDSAKRRKKSAGGFVNAVLRSAVRSGKNIPLPAEIDENYLSVRYSIPEWMINMWCDQYGGNVLQTILEGTDRVPYTTLTVNTLKISAEELADTLISKDCGAETDNGSDTTVLIKNGFGKAVMSAVENGLCFVQDASSQAAVRALAPKPGDTVIDTCACPGGKSFCSAIFMQNSGTVLSRDLHENKLSLIQKGAGRLGLDIIKISRADAAIPDPDLTASADRVICDVPCSGLGVIAKKPDIRHKTPEEISGLPDVQRRILEASSTYIKLGGRLLYSTCTLNKAENEAIVEGFLLKNTDYRLIEEKTIFPCIKNDGFFYAVIERI